MCLRRTFKEVLWRICAIPVKTAMSDIYLSICYKCHKRNAQLNIENIDENSTTIWTKNIIQQYEERHSDQENCYLVEYAAWYAERCYLLEDNFDSGDELNNDHDLPNTSEKRQKSF